MFRSGTTPTHNAEAPLLLVADDDPDIRRLISFRLESGGYRVVTADDGEEALSMARRLLPDLAVLDVMMPKLDGYSVTREIRARAETESMPVLLVTGRVQEADVSRGFHVGADDYVPKPFSPDELRARVAVALGRR